MFNAALCEGFFIRGNELSTTGSRRVATTFNCLRRLILRIILSILFFFKNANAFLMLTVFVSGSSVKANFNLSMIASIQASPAAIRQGRMSCATLNPTVA